MFARLVFTALWRFLFGARKAVEFIHLDDFSLDVLNDLPISSCRLHARPFDPAMDGLWVNPFNAGD
jgi:hypothetical protein